MYRNISAIVVKQNIVLQFSASRQSHHLAKCQEHGSVNFLSSRQKSILMLVVCKEFPPLPRYTAYPSWNSSQLDGRFREVTKAEQVQNKKRQALCKVIAFHITLFHRACFFLFTDSGLCDMPFTYQISLDQRSSVSPLWIKVFGSPRSRKREGGRRGGCGRSLW